MKIKIEKTRAGVRLEVTPDGHKQPIVIDLDDMKCVMLAAVVEAARKAQGFKFEAEL